MLQHFKLLSSHFVCSLHGRTDFLKGRQRHAKSIKILLKKEKKLETKFTKEEKK